MVGKGGGGGIGVLVEGWVGQEREGETVKKWCVYVRALSQQGGRDESGPTTSSQTSSEQRTALVTFHYPHPHPHPHPGPLPSTPYSHQPTAHSLPPSPTFTCSWSYLGAYLWQWLGVQVGRALEPLCYCLETVAVLWRSCVLPHSVQRMVNYSLWWILGEKNLLP